MSAPKEGWPAGMVCEVTRDPTRTSPNIEGEIVIVEGPSVPLPAGTPLVDDHGLPAGILVQPVRGLHELEGHEVEGYWPADWLRPLTDPDAETQGSDAELEVTP